MKIFVELSEGEKISECKICVYYGYKLLKEWILEYVTNFFQNVFSVLQYNKWQCLVLKENVGATRAGVCRERISFICITEGINLGLQSYNWRRITLHILMMVEILQMILSLQAFEYLRLILPCCYAVLKAVMPLSCSWELVDLALTNS